MKRIELLKKRLFDEDFTVKKEWWGDGETILVSDEIKALPLIVRKALAIKHVADNMPVEIKKYELIVGKPTMASVGFGKCFPQYTLPQEDEEARKYGFTPKSVFGHHPADFEKVLKKGIKCVREDVMRKLAEIGDEDVDPERYHFYESVLISLEALRDLSMRYVVLLLQTAEKTEDTERRKELLKMAEVCSRVPENPAETLHEALQSVWMAYTLFHSTMEFIPIGRADQYLYPYYKADIDAGRLTREEAEELVGSFLVKFNERVHMDPAMWEMHMTDEDTQFNGVLDKNGGVYAEYGNDESYNYGTSANHWLTNMILGGVTPSGEDATNDMTYILLEQWAYLEIVVPVLSVRLSKKSPEKLYRRCATILRNGSGEPAIYNDEIFIEGYQKLGIPAEEARDYSNDGCWETLIPGRTSFGFCMLQVLQLLEYMMQDGKSLVRGRSECSDVPSLSSWKNFDAFYSYFLHLLENSAEKEIDTRLATIAHRAAIAPSPLLSAYMEDSVERGMEYSVGGARYKIFGMMLTGFANCVDSLAVIKKLVFEEQAYTLEELAEATRIDFAGLETMRQRIINTVPKFGNDDRYVDELAKKLLADYAAIIERLRKKKLDGLLLVPGIATFEFYAKWGHDIGASADGRHAQEPVASNYSPCHGMDMKGPTAAIKSLTFPDMLPFSQGGPLDMEINPGEVGGEAGITRMVGLIKAFKELGGLILTITGVTREKLLAAQKEPEKHRSLRVRLGGLSAYFVTLSKEMQESIIRRTPHSL